MCVVPSFPFHKKFKSSNRDPDVVKNLDYLSPLTKVFTTGHKLISHFFMPSLCGINDCRWVRTVSGPVSRKLSTLNTRTDLVAIIRARLLHPDPSLCLWFVVLGFKKSSPIPTLIETMLVSAPCSTWLYVSVVLLFSAASMCIWCSAAPSCWFSIILLTLCWSSCFQLGTSRCSIGSTLNLVGYSQVTVSNRPNHISTPASVFFPNLLRGDWFSSDCIVSTMDGHLL